MRCLCVKSRSAVFPLARRAGCRRFIYMTDRMRDPDPAATARHLPAGTVIILRDYHAPDRTALAQQLRRITRQRRQALWVAGDARLARRVRADGVHLGEQAARRQVRPGAVPVRSVACHSRRALWRARLYPAALRLVSPLFSTTSGGGKAGLGVHRFARLIQGSSSAVAALGGVTASSAARLMPLTQRRQIEAVAAISGARRPV